VACRLGRRLLPNAPFESDGNRTADRVAHGRVLLGECKQLVQLRVAAIRLDIHSNTNLAIARRHRGVEGEQALQVDHSFKLRRDRLDVDTSGGRVQDRRRRDAPRERMQQELDWVCALIVAEQYGRLAIREFEAAATGLILLTRTEEILDRGAVLAAS